MLRTDKNCKPMALFTALVISLIAGIAQNATADEGDLPFWFSDQYANFAAVPTATG